MHLLRQNARPKKQRIGSGTVKINVIGTSGSGKSTVARGITQKLNIPYIQLDALFWRADWQGTPDDLFFAKIEAALAGKNDWVIDGNYKRTHPSSSVTWI